MAKDNIYQTSICKINCGNQQGTGFLITENLIITANHVVSDFHLNKKEISVNFPIVKLEENFSADCFSFNEDLDIAIIKLDNSQERESYLNLLKSPLYSGESWSTFGFPKGEVSQIGGENLKGIVNRRITNHFETIHDIDLYCDPFDSRSSLKGYSGSPVFDKDYNVVAIILKHLNRSVGAISVDKIFKFLSINKIKIETDYEKYDTKPLSRNWFEEHISKVVIEAGPRYTQAANVDLDYGKYFDAVGRTENFYKTIREIYAEIKSLSRDITIQNKEKLKDVTDGIETVLVPLFVLLDKILDGDKKDIEWNALTDLAEVIRESVNEQYYVLIERGKGDDVENKPYRRNKYDHEIDKLRKLLGAVQRINEFSCGKLAQLFNCPFFLLKGKAGQGKTHLLCDTAVNRIEHGYATIMLFGHHFQHGDPWKQILSKLDLPFSKAEFLDRLNTICVDKGKKGLIFIDALNEGAGKDLWKDNLSALIADLKRYPMLGLVFSIRTPFENIIVPKELIDDDTLVVQNHNGFAGNEYKAVKEYFRYYNIELFSIPLLESEFSNPLYLKTFCEAFKEKRYTCLPKGAQKFSYVFNLFLEQKNAAICNEIDEDPRLDPLSEALNIFSRELLSNGKKWLDRKRAHKLCEEIVSARGWSKSLLFHMISEGVIFESLAPIDRDNWIDTIEFSYERFSDHLKAKYLLPLFEKDEYRKSTTLNKIFQDYPLHEFQNLIHALSILLAERYGKELCEYYPEFRNHRVIIDSFFDSLIWRSYDSIQKDKVIAHVRTLENEIDIEEEGVDISLKFLNVLLLVASDPDHPFNSNYLHELLWKKKIAERDSSWSITINNLYEDNSVIVSYINWALLEEDKKHISDTSLLFSSTVLAWFLTTSNRFLRDDATKALINVLKDRPTVVVELLNKFHGINDLYISERLYAVAYGCILQNTNNDDIKIIAQIVYNLVFKDNNPPVHFLLRDYARNCIERAIFLKIDINVEVDKIRPPYNSEWIEPISELEAEKFDIVSKENYTNEELGQSLLYNSVMGFGDFARYTIGTNLHMTNWSLIRIKQKQDYLLLKNTLKGKAKAMLKTYSLMIKNKFLYENAPDYKKELIGHDFIANISKGVLMTESFFLDLVDDPQKEIIKTSVKPYLNSIYNKKNGRCGSFDLSILQRLIIKKVFDLGWKKELFGDNDYYLNRYNSSSREAQKKERVGKKYQWIALHEYLARLADNFEYNESYSSGKKGNCKGPWQDGFHRDIDPSISLRKRIYSPSERFKGIFEVENNIDNTAEICDWLKTSDNLPKFKDLFQIIDQFGDEWISLESFLSLEEKVGLGEDKFKVQRKSIWVQAKSYIVKKSKKKTFYNWAIKQDFMGRWMPESSDRYEYFLGESFWAPAYNYTRQPSYGFKEWHNPMHSKTGIKHGVNIMVTTEHFLKEAGSSSYDCSMDESLSIYLPCKLIVDGMKLHIGKKEGYMYNEFGTLIAFDPSVLEGGPSSLLIRKDEFIKFLNDNDLDIVFTILGEKNISGSSMLSSQNYGRMEISGAYNINNELEIEGKYNMKNK